MKRIRSFSIAVLILLAVVVSAVQADAAIKYGNNGYLCYKTYVNSGRIFIGDSRTCQMWHDNHYAGSFFAVWAGHYGYGGACQIDTAERIALMRSQVRKTINKKGYCRVFIFATINDYDGHVSPALEDEEIAFAAQSVIRLAETAYTWKKSYNGKAVTPKVFILSLVPNKGEIDKVKKFNAYIKARAKASTKIKGYIDITKCLAGSNGGYESDNVHYNSQTIANINRKLIAYG